MLLAFTACTVTESSTPYHHISYYDLGQNIILQYAKKIKTNMNTSCIPLINSIIFQNVSSHSH